jgi:hypothetical protein
VRRLDEARLTNRWAKSAAPFLARVLTRTHLLGPMRLGAHYVDILRGLGAGTGWDMTSETALATASVTVSEPVVLDVGANQGRWAVEIERLLRPLHPGSS